MWVFLFLFSIQQQKDTQSIEGVTFSSLFYSNFPLVMDHGYPVLEVYFIEKNMVFMASWEEKFSSFFGQIYLHITTTYMLFQKEPSSIVKVWKINKNVLFKKLEE